MPWSLKIRCTPTLNTAQLVSLACETYSYSGGAHGNNATLGHTFAVSATKVRRLGLEDLFRDFAQARVKLSRLCLESLRAQGASEVTGGSISKLSDELSQVTVSREGMRFFFPPYSVGAYVEGEYSVLLRWKEIRRLIGKSSPLWPILEDAESSR